MESMIAANITSMPYNQDVTIIPEERMRLELSIARLITDENIFKAIPPWIPIVSTIGALIVLAAIVFALRQVIELSDDILIHFTGIFSCGSSAFLKETSPIRWLQIWCHQRRSKSQQIDSYSTGAVF